MASSESRSAVVLELAEEFLERYRRGERPGLKEYIDRHPDLAGEIREVFPAMAMMENIAIRDDSLEGDRTEAKGLARPDTPVPGQIGDFRIIREIGQGGMGAVYEAEQVSLGRHVALKLLLPQVVRNPKLRQRFEREARAAGRLHHTNIVPVFGVGEHDGTAYYVMQYIPGLGLDEVIDELRRQLQPGDGAGDDGEPRDPTAANDHRRNLSAVEIARSMWTGRFEPAVPGGSSAKSPIESTQAATDPDGAESTTVRDGSAGPGSPDAAPRSSSSVMLPGSAANGSSGHGAAATYWQSVARVGVQVASALDYAHGQGILHRDIKPSNLLLDTRGTVWVADFGLAKADDQRNLTATGDILGTLRYMPPEAFEGRSDARSDVYSMGLTLYEMLAFRPAFDQKDRARLISQVTGAEPVRLSKLNPAIPRDLDTIVHKAIDRDPDHRYGTAGELAADLRRFVDDEPIRARRMTRVERVRRWARRHRALAWALSAAAVALIAGTAVSVAMAIRANRFADRAEAAAREANLALGVARRSAEAEAKAAREARAESARQAAARGLSLIDQKDSARGMLWLVRALELDPEDASGVHHAVRVNLLQTANEQLATPRLTLRPAGLAPGPTGRPSDEIVSKGAYSPDGRFLATAHRDRGRTKGMVRIWNTVDGRELANAIEAKVIVSQLKFSPDGSRLWVGWDGARHQLQSLDVASLKPADKPLNLPGSLAAFRPDGRAVAIGIGGANNILQVIDRETGRPLGPVFENPRHQSRNSEVTFSPDGRSLAMGESNDRASGVSRAAVAWEVETGKLRFETAKVGGYHINAIAWSPDGKTVATGGHDRILRFWDAATGAPRGLARVQSNVVAELEYSPDGRSLAVVLAGRVGNEPFQPAKVRMLDSGTGLPVGPEWSFDAGVLCLAFSPDGESLAVGLTDGTAEIRDLPRANPLGRPLKSYAPSHSVAVGADDRIAFDMGNHSGEVGLYDPASDDVSVLARFKNKGIWSAAFGPDGKTLAIATGYHFGTGSGPPDAEVWLYDTDTKRLICPAIPTGDPIAQLLGFSRDGAVVYTIQAHAPRMLRRWDARTGQALGGDVALPPATNYRAVAVSRDDRLALFAGPQGRVTRCELPSGRTIGEPWPLQPQGIKIIRIGPDGHSFVTVAADSTVRLWDIETGRPLGPPIEYESEIEAVAIGPDGRTVVVATTRRDVRFWDARVGLPLGSYRDYRYHVQAIDFYHAGDRVAIATSAGVFVVPIPDGITGGAAEVRRWAEARAGWTLEAAGAVARLTPAEWARRRREFAVDGGEAATTGWTPDDDRDRHYNIAAFGADKDYQAQVWHLDRVLTDAPDAHAARLNRAGAHARLGHSDLALSDLERVLALGPRGPSEWSEILGVLRLLPEGNPTVREFERRVLSRCEEIDNAFDEVTAPHLFDLAAGCGARGRWGLARRMLESAHPSMNQTQRLDIVWLALGDLTSYRKTLKSLFDAFVSGEIKVSDGTWPVFLQDCVLGPNAVGDPDALVRMAETQRDAETKPEVRADLGRLVGAALYRAGRFTEGIARIEEGIRMSRGSGEALDWAFLAMAHAQLGHGPEARRWLDRLASFRAPEGPDRFWEDQRALILRREAEAVIFYDPVFPPDPFAPKSAGPSGPTPPDQKP